MFTKRPQKVSFSIWTRACKTRLQKIALRSATCFDTVANISQTFISLSASHQQQELSFGQNSTQYSELSAQQQQPPNLSSSAANVQQQSFYIAIHLKHHLSDVAIQSIDKLTLSNHGGRENICLVKISICAPFFLFRFVENYYD
jgi:hypothetical protein